MSKRLDDRQLGSLACEVRKLAEKSAQLDAELTKTRADLKTARDRMAAAYSGVDLTK